MHYEYMHYMNCDYMQIHAEAKYNRCHLAINQTPISANTNTSSHFAVRL